MLHWNKNYVKLLYLAIGGLILVYAYFFSLMGLENKPYYGDEFFYMKNAESYTVTGSLKASFTYSGKGSKIGEFDAHGPAYPLLYGGVGKVFGYDYLLISKVNLAILLLSLFLLILSNQKLTTRLFQIILILSSPFTLFYAVSLLPELIHLGGAIILYYLYENYHQSHKERDLWVLVSFILLLGLFRSTWLFALIGLFPFLWNGRRSLVLLLIFSIPSLTWLLQTNFHEGVVNVFSEIQYWFGEGKWSILLETIFFNIKRNIYFLFTYSEGTFYAIWKIWLFASFILGFFLFAKDKLVFSGIVMLAVTFLFTLVFYKFYKWTEWRMMLPLTVFLNLRMISVFPSQYYYKALLIINGLAFLFLIPFQYELIYLRKNYQTQDIPRDLVSHIKTLEQPLVQIDTLALTGFALEQLPVANQKGEVIRYILPYYEMELKKASHFLDIQEGQLMMRSKNIRSQ